MEQSLLAAVGINVNRWKAYARASSAASFARIPCRWSVYNTLTDFKMIMTDMIYQPDYLVVP